MMDSIASRVGASSVARVVAPLAGLLLVAALAARNASPSQLLSSDIQLFKPVRPMVPDSPYLPLTSGAKYAGLGIGMKHSAGWTRPFHLVSEMSKNLTGIEIEELEPYPGCDPMEEALAKWGINGAAERFSTGDGHPLGNVFARRAMDRKTDLKKFFKDVTTIALQGQQVSFDTPRPTRMAIFHGTIVMYLGNLMWTELDKDPNYTPDWKVNFSAKVDPTAAPRTLLSPTRRVRKHDPMPPHLHLLCLSSSSRCCALVTKRSPTSRSTFACTAWATRSAIRISSSQSRRPTTRASRAPSRRCTTRSSRSTPRTTATRCAHRATRQARRLYRALGSAVHVGLCAGVRRSDGASGHPGCGLTLPPLKPQRTPVVAAAHPRCNLTTPRCNHPSRHRR